MTFLSGLTRYSAFQAATAAADAPPTADQFEGWTARAQAAYLSANSADDPPFLVIGDPGSAQILATLGPDGQSVAIAPVPASYAAAASSGALPSSDDFLGWDPELQLAFVRASGVTPPTALLLGNAAGPQVLAALNWNHSGVDLTPVPASYAAAVTAGTAPTADDFEGWPQQLQLAYVQAEIGASPFLLVGAAAGPQILATLDAARTTVTTAPVPASYTAAVAGTAAPSAGDVQGWPQQLQLAYVQARGTGSPPFLIAGDPKDAQVLVKPSLNGKGVVLSAVPQSYSAAALTGAVPAASDAAGWAPELQRTFLKAISRDDPPFLVTADATGRYSLLSLDQNGKVKTSPVPKSYADAMATGCPPSYKEARDWPEALQLSFLRSGSSDVPPFLVTEGPNKTLNLVTLDPSGTKTDSAGAPQSYADAVLKRTPPSAADFGTGAGAWPLALQLAYVRGTGTPPYAIVDPASPDGVLVTPSADGRSAVTVPLPQSYGVAVAAYAAGAPPAGAPTVAAFQVLSPADQIAYLEANGSGSPPALMLDAGQADAVLVTPNAAVNPTAAVLTPMADVLQSWAPQLQLSFVKAHGTALKLKDGTAATVLALGSGQNAYTATLAADGTAVGVLKGDFGSQSYWGTTTAAVTSGAIASAVEAGAASSSGAPTASGFQAWTASAQAAYVEAQTQDVPAFAVIGDPGTGQVLASMTANGGVFTAPVPASYAAAVKSGAAPSLADFQSWANALQIAYVRANGSGSPPSLTLGTGNQTVTAALGSGGVMLTSSSAYMQSTLALFTAAGYSSGKSSLSPSAFFGLPRDIQAALYNSFKAKADQDIQNHYVNRVNGTTVYPDLTSRDSLLEFGNNTLDLTDSNDSYRTTSTSVGIGSTSVLTQVPADTFPGLTSFLSLYGVSSATGIQSWPSQVQAGYVAANGLPAGSYPKSLVIDGGGTTLVATILSAGDQVQITPVLASAGFDPASFLDAYGTGASVSADDFASWPFACQQAFAGRVLGSSTTGSYALTSSLGAVSIVPTTAANGTTLTGWALQLADASTLPPPSGLDTAAFQAVLTPAQQAAYLTKYGQGTPPVLKATYGGASAVMSSPSATTGGDVTLEPVPAGYATDPSALDPTVFAGWSAAVRQSYVIDNGLGADHSVTIGSSGKAQIAASLSGAGALVTVAVPDTPSTTGMADNIIPYYYMPGGTDGLAASVNQTVANALFPVLNGDPTVAGSTILPTNPQTPADKQLVADFNTPPGQLDPATFGAWNSAIQLQYLRVNAGLRAADGTLAIGSATGAHGVVHAFMSAPTTPQLVQQKVYVVESLQKVDIVKMTLADQQTLAKSTAFQAIAQALGLIPDGLSAVAPGQSGVDTANNALPTALTLVQAQLSKSLAMIADPTKLTPTAQQDGDMPAADRKIFTDEINLVGQQLANSAVFSLTDIQTQLDTITARFARANAFSVCVNVPGKRAPDVSFPTIAIQNAPYPGSTYQLQYYDQMTFNGQTMSVGDWVANNYTIPLPADGAKATITWPAGAQCTANGLVGNISFALTGTVGVTFARSSGNPSSLDGNATIASGYNTFITQERQVLTLAQRAQSLATTGKLTTQYLDGPNLVYLFQLFANLTGEAVIRMDTEEVSQTNATLQMYSAMQNYVQQAVQACGTDTTGSHSIPNPSDGATQAQLAALKKMFDNGNSLLSPIEILKGIKRPINTQTYYDDNAKQTLSNWTLNSSQWNSYNQQLSTAVSSINQDSQIKMNDINDETKQKDRNFDLANSALQKAQDTISKITAD